MAARKNEVATAKEAQLPAEFMDELAAAGEQHQESMSKDDMSIPFLGILQSLSPQCTKGEPEYIKGAEPSDLFDTVTQKVFKTTDDDGNPIECELRILPIFYKRSMIEWVPRNKGGGLVKEYSVDDGMTIRTARNDANQDIIQAGSPLGTPGNQLVDTHTHFVFVIHPDGTYEPMILAMSSTQLKPSKDLNNMVSKHKLPDGRKAPRYFGIYSITTQRRSNDKGAWYIWKFEKVTDVLQDDKMPMFREAKAFYEGVEAGEHKADYSKADGDVNPTTASAEGGGEGKDGDEDIPF